MEQPKTITVHLRIVGLFFSATVEIENNQPLSIKNIIDAYISKNPIGQPGGLAYTVSASGPKVNSLSLLSFTHNYDGTFEEKGHKDDCGRTIGGKLRAKGLYRLQELVLDPVVVAWQSYVIDATTNLNKTKTKPGTKGFTTFDTPLRGTEAIGDGDTIVWRMVAIARRPNVFEEPTTCPSATGNDRLSE